jgi:hypothetical protein
VVRFLSRANASLRLFISSFVELIFNLINSFFYYNLVASSTEVSTYSTNPFLGLAFPAADTFDLSLDPSLLMVFSVGSWKN